MGCGMGLDNNSRVHGLDGQFGCSASASRMTDGLRVSLALAHLGTFAGAALRGLVLRLPDANADM